MASGPIISHRIAPPTADGRDSCKCKSRLGDAKVNSHPRLTDSYLLFFSINVIFKIFHIRVIKAVESWANPTLIMKIACSWSLLYEENSFLLEMIRGCYNKFGPFKEL